MYKGRSILTSSLQNFRKWPSNPRIYVIAALLIVFISSDVFPIAHFSDAVHVNVAPWVFPFLMSDNVTMIVVMLGIVFLFCDAPFIDATQPYLVVRAGRRNWFVGQIVYIMSASALYLLYVLLLSFVFFIPHIAFVNDWGRMISTLALNGQQGVPMYKQAYNIPLSFSAYITGNYLPIAAMGWSLLITWLESVFLGLLMFLLNMHINRVAGAAVAVGLILLGDFVYQFGNVYLALYFSPLSWVNLNVMDATGLSQSPSKLYALVVLFILAAVLAVFAIVTEKKQNIDVIPQI